VWLPSNRGYYLNGLYYTKEGIRHNKALDETQVKEFFEEMLCFFDDNSNDKYFLKQYYNKKQLPQTRAQNLLKDYSETTIDCGLTVREVVDYCKQLCEVNLSNKAMQDGKSFSAVQLFLQNNHNYATKKEVKSESHNTSVQHKLTGEESLDELRQRLNEKLK
jgi:hypothetical protein